MKPAWIEAMEELEVFCRETDLKVSEEGHAGLIRALMTEVTELRASFELRWAADMRAIKRWQAAHPGKEQVWPDHADLVVWLLEQLDAR